LTCPACRSISMSGCTGHSRCGRCASLAER